LWLPLPNVALGKPYTLNPAPNYSLCNGPGYATNLTAGQFVSASSFMWTQPGAVGWQRVSPVTITIDLQTNLPIAGVSFSTAAGGPGDVDWPAAILVFVSQDSNTWTYAGDLVALSFGVSFAPPVSHYSAYATRRYKTNALGTQGRFVQLVVVPGWCAGAFRTFVDEIEVYLGSNSLLAQPAPGPVVANTQTYAAQMVPGALLRRRLGYDLAAVNQELNAASLTKSLSQPLRSQIYTISSAISAVQLDPSLSNSFSTMFPINALHQSIFSVQAGVWSAMGLNGIVTWQSNRWDMLNPTAAPVPAQPNVNIAMMSNEYRAEAFNLSNAGQNNAQVTLVLSGLPGGANPPYVTVQTVAFTDTFPGTPVGAALLPAQQQAGTYLLQIPPGLTCQVWLTFHPTSVPAGTYTGQIVLGGDGQKCAPIPVSLQIYPFVFPAQPTLHLCGWDYTGESSRYEFTPANSGALVQTLKDHYVDSPWEGATPLTLGTYGPDGTMTSPPDLTAFRYWLSVWPNARAYCVQQTDVGSTFAGFSVGTPAWQNCVSNWISWWVSQLAISNIQPTQLNLCLVDEPQTTAQDSLIIQYANVIHAAQPGVVVWEDPIWQNLSQATPAMFQVSDVLCPNLPLALSCGQNYFNFFANLAANGHRLWFYTANSPGRLRDPYYLRSHGWYCWNYGAQGFGLWSFSDSGGSSSWNEYASSYAGAYTPLFLNLTSVTQGKQMEAIREGVEDYEYLRMLRDQIAALQAQGLQTAALANAQSLLNSACGLVLPALGTSFSSDFSNAAVDWCAPRDHSVADTVRIQILNSLVQLSGP
jgi:hypothetical protein